MSETGSSLTRRTFSTGCAAALITSTSTTRIHGLATAAAQAPGRDLIARPASAQLLEDGQPETPVWAYDGVVPGPVLRVRQGETLAARLVNNLDQATTVHWHGVRIDNAMDGVANLTQPPVEPGATFDYRFTPPDAGTYWYHPHNRTWEQLARGLYGPLIVDEEKPPSLDKDVLLVFDDWRLEKNGKIHAASLGSMHDISHGGRLGNILTVNGQFIENLEVKAGERLRLRLVNAANARIIGIVFDGHAPLVVALDGQPTKPFAPNKNMIVLAPAQRADIVLDCDRDPGSRTPIHVDVGRERLQLGEVVYHTSQRQREKTLSDVLVLPKNPLPDGLDENNAQTVRLEMTGGAMAPFESAQYQGKDYGIRELVREHRKAWAFNGIVGMPQSPIAEIARGRTVTFQIINRTAWPHAMHFHGHHVKELAHSARAAQPHWRDTVFIERDQEITVAFKADNPGRWMLHCHMLAHQAGGMSTWYEVA